MAGPLTGVKVVEMNAIGPAPFAAMMLADMGAEVIRIDRQVANFLNADGSLLSRGRRSIAIDPRKPGASDVLLKLIDGADVLIEGFRPGVMERLGLGPDVCLQRNPRSRASVPASWSVWVSARMSAWSAIRSWSTDA
ncbi:Formyl-coenzyme A transferase [compost metagenome]